MPNRSPQVFDLIEEGLVMGGSTGVNVAGAIRMARELGPGHTIVTVLCDYGSRYASKLFNPGLPPLQGASRPGVACRRGRTSSVPFEKTD